MVRRLTARCRPRRRVRDRARRRRSRSPRRRPAPRRRSTRRSRCGGSTRSASSPSSWRGSRRCSAWSSSASRSSRCRAGATSSARSPPTQRSAPARRSASAAIGKRLGVDVVVTGTVGAMGDNYVLNIKAVDVATAKQLAAHPERSAARQPRRADRGRARRGVQAARAATSSTARSRSRPISSAPRSSSTASALGKTPLPKLGVISRKLRSASTGCASRRPATTRSRSDVEVHFQKVSPVVVRLLPADRRDRHRQDRARRAPAVLHEDVVHRRGRRRRRSASAR